MSREIKFRGWNGISMEYGGFSVHATAGIPLPERLSCMTSSSPIMQYTGLKDKNGVEIYEGDVIELDGISCAVTFDNGGYHMITAVNQGRSPLIQERVKRFVVIGNIHQNPELLEPKSVDI